MRQLASAFFPLLAVAATCLPAVAQDQPAKQEPRPEPQAQLVSIDFPGGTMAELVRSLRSGGATANIVLVEDARAWQVPPINAVKTTVIQVLQAVSQATESDDARLRVLPSGGPGEPIFSLRVERRTKKPTSKPDERVTVVSLLELTQPAPGDPTNPPIALRPETILTAIESGAHELLDVPVLRYHGESGLLFVKGDEEQLQFVREVLSNLERDQKIRRQRALMAKVESTGRAETGKPTDK